MRSEQDITRRELMARASLISVKAQHDAGRRLTDLIQAQADKKLSQDDRTRLIGNIGEFIRMYRPHEAREDTVLFRRPRQNGSRRGIRKDGRHRTRNRHLQFASVYAEGVESLGAARIQV